VTTAASPLPAPKPIALRAMRPRDFRPGDAALLVGSALGGVALVWLIFDQLTLLSGAPGFVICSYTAGLLLYWASTASVYGRLVARDRVVTALLYTAAVACFTPLVAVVAFVVAHGYQAIHLHFFVADDTGVGPLSPAGAAGGLHAIVGTLEQNGIAALLGGPAAVLTAVFLNEVGGRTTRMVRTVVTAMSGIPSIVAGLFIYTVWVIGPGVHSALGARYSGLAGALALGIILLPTVTRTTEEVLRLVPGGLREASLALGASEWRTTWSVVLPTARSGLITAMLLGIALTVGETAPLLFTTFGSHALNTNPLHGPQMALPLAVFQLIFLPLKSQVSLGYSTAFVLLMLVLVLFAAARAAGALPSWRRRRGLRKGGRR
jgi:phosphate transport system permease protein